MRSTTVEHTAHASNSFPLWQSTSSSHHLASTAGCERKVGAWRSWAVIPGIWKVGAAGGAVVCADPNWNGVVPPKPDDCPNWNVGSGIVAPNWNGFGGSVAAGAAGAAPKIDVVDDVEGTDESEGVDELAPPNDPKVLLVDPKPKLRPPFAVGAAGGAGADAPKSGLLMEFVADAPNSGGFCASMDAANAAPNGDGLKLSDEAVVADPKKDGGFVASGALPNDENSGFAVVEDPNRPVPEDGPVRGFPADSAFVVVPRRPPEDETWLEFVDEARKWSHFRTRAFLRQDPRLSCQIY